MTPTYRDAMATLKRRVAAGEFDEDVPGFDRELAQCEELANGEIAEKEREIAEQKQFLGRFTAEKLISDVLQDAGVPPLWRKPAAALLRERLGDVEDVSEATVRASLDALLDSEDGAAFRPKREAEPYFFSQLQLLRGGKLH